MLEHMRSQFRAPTIAAVLILIVTLAACRSRSPGLPPASTPPLPAISPGQTVATVVERTEDRSVPLLGSTPTPAPSLTPAAKVTPAVAPSPAARATPAGAGAPAWGSLANPGLESNRIKAAFFFPGQARDGTAPYGCTPDPNLALYTAHPVDSLHLEWSDGTANRQAALKMMVDAGVNVVFMSSWGEQGLPCREGWAEYAPMQTSPAAQDELFSAAAGQPLLIVPVIESRGNWRFVDEFPTWEDGRVAPGTVSQIVDLVARYLKNPAHPEYADRWARLYDRKGQARYAVAIMHVASGRLEPDENAAFARGLDLLAGEVKRRSGVEVGFLLDLLPPASNAPGTFKASATMTGPMLHNTDAVLAISCYMPEVWTSSTKDEDLLDWKAAFAKQWVDIGIPFLIDVSPGYNGDLVFRDFRHHAGYGLNAGWRNALSAMVVKFGGYGLVFDAWNGYTESTVAVPTLEYGDSVYLWLKGL